MANNFTIVLTPTGPPPVAPSAFPVSRTTAHDMIQSLRDYCGAQSSGFLERDARRALIDAYREYQSDHNWTYYQKHGRIQVYGKYTQGSVTYTQATQQITLSGGVWPAWAGRGYIRIGTGTGIPMPSNPTSGVTAYLAINRISDSILQLDPILNPGQDITPPCAYTLYEDTYEMPDDFQASDQWYADVAWGGMTYVRPNQWLQVTRYYFSFSNTPRYFTFKTSPWTQGRLALSLFPFPDQDRTLDSMYRKRPRPITISDYNSGTISGAAGTNTVSGNGTVWTPAMVGSVFRVGGMPLPDRSNLPTNFEGDVPYAEEHMITAYNSGTQISIDTPLQATYAGVLHRISDPIDVEDGAMMDAFRLCCEKKIARQRSMKTFAQAAASFKEALILAREADERSFETRTAGMGGALRTRMAYMPTGVDIP
jgi:hypothetical protein